MPTRSGSRLYTPTIRGDVDPPPPESTMRIGVRTKTGGSVARQTTDWNNAVAVFGPMTYSRGLYYGPSDSLPTRPEYFSPATVLQIPSFRNTNLSSIVSHMRNMRAPALITYHHEPEGDYAHGSTFVTQFRAAYDAVKAANPHVQVGMAAGGFRYRSGQNGADGSFIPPADKCDFYGIDTYRSGTSASSPLVPLNPLDSAGNPQPHIAEFQTWHNLVKDLGRPLYVTEYGRGFENTDGSVTAAQRASIRAIRPGLLQADYLYLKGLGFKSFIYWWNSNSPGDDWKFNDQPSIDAWKSIVAAETT